MKFLNDFSVEEFDCIVFHGLANGGGEKVITKIQSFFPSSNFISHKEFQFRKLIKGRKILFTSGPRDTLYILICLLLGRKVYTYVQVPFYKTMSIIRPVHFILCLAYYFFINLTKVYSNSKNSSKYIFNCEVILPITLKEFKLCTKAHMRRDINKNKFFTACRLNDEIGKPSRNLNFIIEFLKNNNNKQLFHFGEISSQNMKILSTFTNYNFMGYHKNWIEYVDGQAIFFSNFEGFGLAAFEAACEGIPVFVSKGFPMELKNLSGLINYYSPYNNSKLF